MQTIIRYLLMRYGEEVLEWTLRRVVETWQRDGMATETECAGDPYLTAVRRAQRLGYDLDPDTGVYFWELPTREQ